MVWIGDTDIPIITDMDTEMAVNTISKNFIDSPPQSYQLNSNLENGTYSAILYSNLHAKSESLEEQRDGLRRLVSLNTSACPIDYQGDKGYVDIYNVTTEYASSHIFDFAEFDLRFLSSNIYQPAFILRALPETGDFNLSKESVIAIDSNTSSSNHSPYVSVATENGSLDLYKYTEDTISFLPPSSFTEYERISLVEVFDNSDNRKYTNLSNLSSGFTVENGMVRSSNDGATSDLEIYNGSWQSLGSVDLSWSKAYISENSNYESTVTADNEKLTQYKGFPLVEYEVTGRTEFSYNVSVDSTESQDSHYRSVNTSGGYEAILIRYYDEESFSVGSSSISVTGLDSSSEYKFAVGFVPSGLTADELSSWIFNRGYVKRTLVQK